MDDDERRQHPHGNERRIERKWTVQLRDGNARMQMGRHRRHTGNRKATAAQRRDSKLKLRNPRPRRSGKANGENAPQSRKHNDEQRRPDLQSARSNVEQRKQMVQKERRKVRQRNKQSETYEYISNRKIMVQRFKPQLQPLRRE